MTVFFLFSLSNGACNGTWQYNYISKLYHCNDVLRFSLLLLIIHRLQMLDFFLCLRWFINIYCLHGVVYDDSSAWFICIFLISSHTKVIRILHCNVRHFVLVKHCTQKSTWTFFLFINSNFLVFLFHWPALCVTMYHWVLGAVRLEFWFSWRFWVSFT